MQVPNRFSSLAAVAIVAVSLAGCSKEAANLKAPSPPRVTGTVAYLQRIALPPDALVRIQLTDVSRADAPATVIGQQEIVTGGKQVPFVFQIDYDPNAIDANHRYTIQATIEVGTERRFMNTQSYGVITQGNPNHVEIVVQPIR